DAIAGVAGGDPNRAAMIARALVSVALAIVASAACLAQEPAPKRVDAIFAQWDRADSPGCAVGIDRDTGLVYSRGYGRANLDYAIPLSAHSRFYLASVSKQFTASAVVLAVRQGKLSLDDDIRKWLPELRDYGTPITVRHLVHHVSGVRDYLAL